MKYYYLTTLGGEDRRKSNHSERHIYYRILDLFINSNEIISGHQINIIMIYKFNTSGNSLDKMLNSLVEEGYLAILEINEEIIKKIEKLQALL